ncbi:MAG: NAD(P)H-binding protein [Xanthobacteraceae bacterium]
MTPSPMLPSALSSASAPSEIQFSRLNGWPVHAPADASPSSSRTPAHGSGSMRIASPSSWRTCTACSSRVSPAHRQSRWGDSRGRGGILYNTALCLFLGRVYADKDVQERIIRKSRLDWTIVRPTILRNL